MLGAQVKAGKLFICVSGDEGTPKYKRFFVSLRRGNDLLIGEARPALPRALNVHRRHSPSAFTVRRVQDVFTTDDGTIIRNFDGRIHLARCQIAWHGGVSDNFSVHHRSSDEAMLLTLPSGVELKIKSLESVAVLTQWFNALNLIPKEPVPRPDASAPQEEEDLVTQLKSKRLYEVHPPMQHANHRAYIQRSAFN